MTDAPTPVPGAAPAPGPASEQRPLPLAQQYRLFREARKAGRPVDFEGMLRAFYTGLLRPGDVAADLGAYQGAHTVSMAQAVRGPGGAVHAFEANPTMAEALRTRFASPGFEHVSIHEAAVAAVDGQADFIVALDDPGYSGLRQREYDRPDMRTGRVRVWTTTLDTMFAALDRLAYVKIDVEGGEFDALRGAARTVERLRPAISFEFGQRSYGAYGVDPGAVFDWFEARGYVLFDIVGNVLLAKDRFLRSDSIPGLWDYLALPSERGDLKRLARGQAQLLARFAPGVAKG